MIGMLWRDTSTVLLSVKIQKALDYYVKKYNQAPDVCLVHPSMLEPNQAKGFVLDKLHVRPYRYVTPGHIWIGIEDKN